MPETATIPDSQKAAAVATLMAAIMRDGTQINDGDKARYRELAQTLTSAKVEDAVDVLALISLATALVLRMSDELPDLEPIDGVQPRDTLHNASVLLINALTALEGATGVAGATFIGRSAKLN